MKKLLIVLTIILANLGSTPAQNFVGQKNPYPNKREISNGIDTLSILCVMVEFQEDRYDATEGNGKFGSIYTVEHGDTVMDPLPHNAEYFADHLLFAKNYYEKVSNGNLILSYEILPDVITVSNAMREYVPEYNSNDFSPLASLSEEAWQIADQNNPDIDFSSYDLFIVFHAGISNALQFDNVIVNRNLPSLYLSHQAFKNIYGVDFAGYPVNNNSSFINNSIFLPETESREVESIDGSILLWEMSINGSLVANIASHLGLPDLFNTETGLSVIGRFGLMDSQGFNANYGLFPPEPSAWEKIYLGWETPRTIEADDYTVMLSAVNSGAFMDEITTLKVPINSSEYFLLENRQQDVFDNDVVITYKVHGETFTKVILPDSTGKYIIDQDEIDGVVIDVDEFDIAVPGNGIVIWHIDENVINEKMATNSINNDLYKRGVDVEEADGIQDIGFQYNTIFGTIISEGVQEDLWYASNTAEYYVNEFGPETKPNTKSNYGADSFIKFYNFPESSNMMVFNVSFQNNGISLEVLKNLELVNASSFDFFTLGDQSFIYVMDELTLKIYSANGQFITSVENFSRKKPAITEMSGTTYLVGAVDNIVNISVFNGSEAITNYSDAGVNITAPVTIVQFPDHFEMYFGTEQGTVLTISSSELERINSLQNSIRTATDDNSVLQIAAVNNFYSFVAGNNYSDINGETFSFDSPVLKSALTLDENNQYTSVILTEGNTFEIIKLSVHMYHFIPDTEGQIDSFILADLYKDGNNYIIFTDGNKLFATNLTGAVAPNFPISDPEQIGFVGIPQAADLNGDGIAEIFAETADGRVIGFDASTGKELNSFSSGDEILVSPILFNYNGFASLAVINKSNDYYLWKISDVSADIVWSGDFTNPQNSSFVEAASNDNPVSEIYFPTDHAYNWPNPVYGDETNIRYYVSETSEVNIKIFDMSGDLVAELQDFTNGGMDHETIWNVSNIQSGVYFARIEVNSTSGKSGQKLIKIAVIK